jgi:hypothetical protein
MVGDENEVLEVWAEYFKELLNPQINVLTLEENNYFGPEYITLKYLQCRKY